MILGYTVKGNRNHGQYKDIAFAGLQHTYPIAMANN